MKTRDQHYATLIYQQVMDIKNEKNEAYATTYGSTAHKLPILIHTSGLIQALTFVSTRKEEGPRRLLEDLSKTVLGTSANATKLLDQAKGGQDDGLQTYIHLTRQVLAALLWYKRYAQSILGVESGQDIELNKQGEGNHGGDEK